MELQIIDNKGAKKGSVQFDEKLAETKASQFLLQEAVVAYLAGQRSGTHDTKTRSQVSGGGKKPWRQKGTGRARSGSIRSPLWRKGGIIFGPHPRDYSQDLPKKKKKAAFRLAIKTLLAEDKLQVVEPIDLKEVKTKVVAAVYKKWKAPSPSLLLVEKIDSKLKLATRNISSVLVKDVASLNIYDCLKARKVFITQGGLGLLSDRLGKSAEN